MKQEKKRQANFELLRIVCMLMITVLHYMHHGGMLTAWHEGEAAMTGVNAAAWIIEAFCLCGMSCFIMLSGYFLTPEKWSPKRLIGLILQCLFYSVTVPVILVLTGAVSMADIDKYDILFWLFPIGTESWWFMTSYVTLYILSPFLSYGVEKIGRNNFKKALLFLIFFESVEKTILPVVMPTDRYGYDALWMITMFLVGRYIKQYGAGFLEKRFMPPVTYGVSCLLMFLISFAAGRAAANGIEGLKYYSGMPYTCNYFLCMTASIGLFCMFRQLTLSEGFISDAARKISPYVLGAYLIHEHPLVRSIWPGWIFADRVRGTFLFIPATFAAALTVLTAGCVCDLLRQKLFALIRRI